MSISINWMVRKMDTLKFCKNDYRILAYIDDRYDAFRSHIIQRFTPDIQGINERISLLLDAEYIEYALYGDCDNSYISTDSFYPTEKGRKALQDYQIEIEVEKLNEKKRDRKYWLTTSIAIWGAFSGTFGIIISLISWLR